MTYQELQSTAGIVIQSINGKPDVSVDAVPGDLVQFRNKQGQAYITTVNQDGSLADPVPASRLPTGLTKTAPGKNVLGAADLGGDPSSVWGKLVDHYAQQLNDPNIDQATKNALYATYQDAVTKMAADVTSQTNKGAALDATTKALSASYDQYVAAGRTPTQSMIEAHNRVVQAGGAGTGGTDQGPSSPVGAAIDSLTNDSRIRMAMRLGAMLEGGSLNSGWAAGDNGMSWGPYQINHNDGMHADISRADSEDPLAATKYMLPEYQAAVNQVPASLWQSDPQQAALQAVYLAEKPAQPYQQTRSVRDIASAWQEAQSDFRGGGVGSSGIPQAVGTTRTVTNKDGSKTTYQYDPASGSWKVATGLPTDYSGSAATKPDIQYVTMPDGSKAPFQYDPNSGAWKPAQGLPSNAASPTDVKAQQDAMPKAQLAIEQYAQTIKYIQDQMSAGAFGTDPAKALATANQYAGAAHSVLTASLQGTTPFELQQLQEKQATANAQVAKDLINQKLQTGAQLADSLMNSAQTMAQHSFEWSGYNPLTYARLLTEQNSGGQATSDLAQKLLQGIAPGEPGSATGTPPGATPDIFSPTLGNVPVIGSVGPPPTPPTNAGAPSTGPATPAGTGIGITPGVGSLQDQQNPGSVLGRALAAGLTGDGSPDVVSRMLANHLAGQAAPAAPVAA